MTVQIERVGFADIDITDSFFDSLRGDYREFEEWFLRKSDESAYILRDGKEMQGFMYLKLETTGVDDVEPALAEARRIKLGTLKIDAHGTRLGQRFLKKAFDHAVYEEADELYVTVFSKQEALVSLLEEFGFKYHGTKTTQNGTEVVLVKNLTSQTGLPRDDYPKFFVSANRKFILPIQPKWHTQLFPDSILMSESYDVVEDLSHTNSIEKCYICFMDASSASPGDLLVIYRTSDGKGPAEYRSVATSICTVEEIRPKSSFRDQEHFINDVKKASVFTRRDLIALWNAQKQREMVVVKMLYNAALTKRLNRKALIEVVGISRDAYPGFLELSDEQFTIVLQLGGVHAGFVVDQA